MKMLLPVMYVQQKDWLSGWAFDLAHPRFMTGQSQAHPNRGGVWINNTVVVDTVVVAESYGSIVRLVHPKEDVDWICMWKREGEREENTFNTVSNFVQTVYALQPGCVVDLFALPSIYLVAEVYETWIDLGKNIWF